MTLEAARLAPSGGSPPRRDAQEPSFVRRGRGALPPLLPPDGIRVGVVSTLRDVQDDFFLWAEWYRIAGFAHLFLYFDDPTHDRGVIDEALAVFSAEFLSVVCNGPELQADWPSLHCWEQFQPYVDDRMCRQLLNIAHCVRRALRLGVATVGGAGGEYPGIDWLMHLDHDELFMPPPEGLQQHFRHLEAGQCRLFLYQNFEAVPETHTHTPFLDVSLFKVPQGSVPRTEWGYKGMEFWAKKTKAGNYFLYYDNGKSAVRLGRGAAVREFAPRSVHVLLPELEKDAITEERAAWTSFAPHDLPHMDLQWMVPQADEVTVAARVLHYPATHFERLFRKYDHLKDFPSVRFGGGLVVPASFHLEARDCYVAYIAEGADLTRQRLKELLERCAMLRDADEVEEQLRAGSVVRIRTVAESLARGVWVAPPAFCESSRARSLRRPSPEQLERLRRLPREDAQVLLVADGGLLKNFEAGIDQVCRHFEEFGWAACALGAHPRLLERARVEAESLLGRMVPGTTVVKNKVIDQRLPNARRGDKILWMQEQGLSTMRDAVAAGDCGETSVANLAMLESALADIGLQLGLRLQRSSLRLRITERCDTMLACYDGDGASYGAHIDNADGDGRIDGRILTAMLYLNPAWDRQDGGELSVLEVDGGGSLTEPSARGTWRNVWPELGTLAFLRSDRTLHEVRPCSGRRFAIALWFCGQAMGFGGDVPA